MGYEIYNNGASIVFIKDERKFFLLKSSITKVSVISNKVVISTGGCLGTINIPSQDVSSPEGYSASDLLNQISYWIYNITPPAGPIE